MRLQSGQIAPDFSTTDIYGKDINLSDYKGKKLLLCFFRYAGCPWCNMVMHSMIEQYTSLHAQGLEVVAFLQSPRESILEYPIKRQMPKPPFPLIADPKRKIYNQYGVEVSLRKFARGLVKIPSFLGSTSQHKFPQGKIDGNLLLMPAFFLIGPDNLEIYKTFYGADFTDTVPYQDILDFLLFE